MTSVPSEQENLDENIDYYKSINSLDQQTAGLKDDPDADVDVQFDIEFETVFKTLATDMYDSPRAGIREALTNATTAILRATREHDLSPSDATIELTLYEDRGMLVIQDNGNGMTRREIEEIVSVIGVSSTLDKEDLAGQFGMGFISLFMLAGLDGGFIMHTHSRKEGASPISGAWQGRGFDYDEEGKLVNRFDEDQYGTRFEIPLDPAIDTTEIRSWVDDLCKYCRIPVVYREVDGSETHNNEYGAHRLVDEYADDEPVLTVETPYFIAHNAPSASGKTLLLDVPTNRNHYLSSRAAPFREIDLRMKQENGVVVKGEHEGKIPLRRSEYSGLPDAIKDKYVVRDQLGSDEVVMPGPISNRDKLEDNPDFWNWLAEQFREAYRERVNTVLQSVSSPDDLFDQSRIDFELAYRFPERIPQRRGVFSTDNRQVFENELDVSLDDAVLDTLLTCLEEVERIPRRDTIDDIEQLGTTKYAGQLAYAANQHDSDVYMGVSLNAAKAQVVWADDDENEVVRVEETDMYETFDTEFGWKKLKTITKDTIDDFDVPDELAKPFKSQQRSSVGAAPDRDVILHFGTRDRRKHTWNVGDLRDALDRVQDSAAPSGLENLDTLVLFPSNSERNVSSHRWLASRNVGIATCPVLVYDYLSDSPLVHHADEYFERAATYSLRTNRGTTTLGEVNMDNVVLHRVDPPYLALFRSDAIISDAAEYIANNVSSGFRAPSLPSADDIIYAPVSHDDMLILRPLLEDIHIVTGDTSYDLNVGSSTGMGTDTPAYAYARLKEYQATPEATVIQNSSTTLADGGFHLVETLADTTEQPFREKASVEARIAELVED